MKNNLTYDEAMARIEAITKELESADIMSLEDYKKKASEAKELIAFCRAQLETTEQDLTSLNPS